MGEVLIIGGGFAGLAAGVALAKAGQRVRLLEQKPHLGGRARSFVDPITGTVVDNGQHLLMGSYHATRRFLKEIGTLDRIRLQPHLKIQFLEPPGKLTTLDCPNLPSPWHVLGGVLRSDSFTVKEKLQIMRLGGKLRGPRASTDDLAYLTVEDWLTRMGQSEKLKRGFWDLLSIAALNEDPRRAAASIFERVLRLALFTSPEDSCLGIPRVGLSDCYVDAAREYITSRGGQVECSRTVASLVIAEGVCRGARLADGRAVAADAVISAVPWVEFTRILPGELLRLEPYFTDILSLRPAPIISVNLWFEKPITDLDFVGLRGTTVQWLFNRGKVSSAAENCVSLVLSGAHSRIDYRKEDLLGLALRDLAELFPALHRVKVTRSLVIKERFATFSPSVGIDALRPPTQSPIRGLYLAGDWTATGLPATIEGAVRSGNSAAAEILRSAGN